MPSTLQRRIAGGALAGALVSASVPAHASPKTWDDASTVAVGALVAASLGTPAVQGDWTGAAQAGGSMAASGGVAYGLKQAFPETRPDGSNRKSFPSGHTSVSFAAAASLENRYGWKAGLPAHVVALFVGVARVEAKKHHWYDVAVGAGIGELTGLLITSKRNPSIQLVPWAEGKAAGVDFDMRF